MADPNPTPGTGDGPQRPADARPAGASQTSAFRAPAPGGFTPRVRAAAISGDAAPAGASLSTPTPAPLPDRGASLFLFIALVAAVLAVTFTILIALKL